MLTREQVLHIAKLSNFELTEDEIKKFQIQLSQVLDYFEILKKVDTSHIPPKTHALDDENRYQENELSQNTISRVDALKNAPQKDNKYFKTKAVL